MVGTTVVTDAAQSARSIISRIGIVSFSITTDASGDADTTYTINKKLEKIFVQIGSLTSGAADVTITDNETGETILGLTNITANSTDYVRRAVDDTAGSAVVAYDNFAVKTIKIVVADGGNAKTGTVDVYYS